MIIDVEIGEEGGMENKRGSREERGVGRVVEKDGPQSLFKIEITNIVGRA